MATITTEFGKVSSKRQRAVYLLVRDKKTVKRIITGVKVDESEISPKTKKIRNFEKAQIVEKLKMELAAKMSTLAPEINYCDKLAADEAGHVAAITSDGRLFLMQKGVIQSSLQLPEGEELFNSVCFDQDGVLLVGTSTNHIYVFEVNEDRFDQKTIRDCGLWFATMEEEELDEDMVLQLK